MPAARWNWSSPPRAAARAHREPARRRTCSPPPTWDIRPGWPTPGARTPSVAVFARNQLCALVREGLQVTTADLLESMLDPAVRVGTSTPKADPSGDYAFALFAKAEARKPGARAILEGKALQLTGGPTSEKAPAGRNQYGWVMSSGKADVFLTYCTNAVLARKDVAAPQIVQIAPELNVGADYGMIVLKDAPASAGSLAALHSRRARGRRSWAGYGFGRGDPPCKRSRPSLRAWSWLLLLLAGDRRRGGAHRHGFGRPQGRGAGQDREGIRGRPAGVDPALHAGAGEHDRLAQPADAPRSGPTSPPPTATCRRSAG